MNSEEIRVAKDYLDDLEKQHGKCNTKISEYKSVCPVYCSNCGQKLMH